MPPKIKTKIRRLRPAVQFTVRRIANKNPRNARTFRQFRRKLTRVTAGLLAIGLLASGIFLNGGELKSDVVETTMAIENSTNETCVATTLATKFENLTTRLANISRQFPELINNLDFCGEGECAAEKQIYENENQIWQLEKEFTDLKTSMTRANETFATTLTEKEDRVLFCENESRCGTAEAELREARECEKELQAATRLFKIRVTVEEEHSLMTEKGERAAATIYIKKIMETVFKNRDRVSENTKFYEQCVAASDASVCQKYVEKVKEANRKVLSSITELGGLQIDIEIALEALEKDIVALEIGRKDSENLKENEGLGWCAEELKEKKSALFAKITSADTKKASYESALENLKTRKLTLQAGLQAEFETAAMHAAAEKRAIEEAAAEAAAAKISAEKRAQAEIIFGIWSAIRNSF